MQSDKPFPQTMELLLEMADLSGRGLGRLLEDRVPDWPYSYSHLARFMAGTKEPTPRLMEQIATGLRIMPETFAEYRLWKARRPYTPAEVGFKQAIANLHRLEEAEDELAGQPIDPARLAARLDAGASEDRAESA